MVSTFTPNINLEEPGRGDDVGTWDTPVNNNSTLLDLVVGANTTVGIGSGNVTLSIAQYRSNSLNFSSTLIQNTTITFPSTFMKPYLVGHLATGSSAFTITLATTVSGGQVVAIPPGEYVTVFNDGTNMKFGTLGRVGTYWDYAGSSVPAWVSACTVPPYLNCTGGTFSATTYPQLAVILGSTTLPDSKGRTRFALDQSAGRISTAATGFSSATVGGSGGAQATTLITANLPAYTPSGTVTVTVTPTLGGNFNTDQGLSGNVGGGIGTVQPSATGSGSLSGAAQGGTSTPFTNLPPAYIGGLTLIRAA